MKLIFKAFILFVFSLYDDVKSSRLNKHISKSLLKGHSLSSAKLIKSSNSLAGLRNKIIKISRDFERSLSSFKKS